MSGNYQAWNADAPGGLVESAAAVREGLATAISAVHSTQLEAHGFYVANGGDVISGHPDVGQPGRMGDPDTTSDASDS